MELEAKYLRLRQPAEPGHRMEDGHVCWLGGWDSGWIFLIVIVLKVTVPVWPR